SNPSAFKQCSRDAARIRECLQTLLQVAETDLTQSYASPFLHARERDQGTGKEIFADAFRKSNDEWKQYRDAECARRRDVTPQGVAADDWQLACVVDLTRRRLLDMR
ncbi:MAG TPA: lysozyme inhibitor LprI family protein, partial [Vicinamibacterales bacterium]|nr:lysozyme inhibitor LprI family protein [Vicinamibacterales bacterium]